MKKELTPLSFVLIIVCIFLALSLSSAKHEKINQRFSDEEILDYVKYNISPPEVLALYDKYDIIDYADSKGWISHF